MSYENIPEISSIEEVERDLDLKLLFDFIKESKDLTDEKRELLTLRFREGKSVREIAQKLNCLEVTVYKRLERVIKKLKVLFVDSTA